MGKMKRAADRQVPLCLYRLTTLVGIRSVGDVTRSCFESVRRNNQHLLTYIHGSLLRSLRVGWRPGLPLRWPPPSSNRLRFPSPATNLVFCPSHRCALEGPCRAVSSGRPSLRRLALCLLCASASRGSPSIHLVLAMITEAPLGHGHPFGNEGPQGLGPVDSRIGFSARNTCSASRPSVQPLSLVSGAGQGSLVEREPGRSTPMFPLARRAATRVLGRLVQDDFRSPGRADRPVRRVSRTFVRSQLV